MVYAEKDYKKNSGEMRMLKSIMARLLPRLGLKGTLIKTGDACVQISRNETDDKVWKKCKDLINQL